MAVAATCPVLVSIVRSLEVVMALIIDIITRDNFVHVDDMRFWYKVIGACTVTLCVTSMSVADKIHQGLTACTRYNYFIAHLSKWPCDLKINGTQENVTFSCPAFMAFHVVSSFLTRVLASETIK